MKILKFGGSSLATGERVTGVAEIVRAAAAEGPVAVVVSALGGVTNELAAVAEEGAHSETGIDELLAPIAERHLEVVQTAAAAGEQAELEELLQSTMAKLGDLLRGLRLVGEASPRSRDRILACGELLSTPIVAAALRRAGVEAEALDARRLIVTDGVFGGARVEMEATGARLRESLAGQSGVAVVPGFTGATAEGETTTLGRGGSDLTASILGVALTAEAVELWTDVDGVMSADPRLVPEAKPIRRLHFDELMELSHFGAKVVYPPSVHPLRARGIPLWIKNTFRPEAPGTLVSGAAVEADETESPVRGITSIDHVVMGRLEGDGMVGVPGVAMRLFGALARDGVSVILISQASSEHSICFAVAPEDLEAARRAVDEEFRLDRRAGDIDELEIEDDVAVVAVVGAAMRERPGIAGRLFSVLGERGVNVRAIAQGSSELNISLVVKRPDEAPAVRAIHDAFFLGAPRTAELWVAGVGNVGGAVLEQIAACRDEVEKRPGWRLVLRGVANSTARLTEADGLEPAAAAERLAGEPAGQGALGMIEELLEERSVAAGARIFVDCTPSERVGEMQQRLLAAGIDVVTANKRPLAGEMAGYRRLVDAGPGRLYCEATVGAGLPVIRTLADQLATGDELARAEGVLSGTASFLTSELARGEPFSRAVRRARELGTTETDPRQDLAGEDIARKLLILARLGGATIERGEVDVEPLVPADPWMAMDLEEFWERLPELDAELADRVQHAAAAGERLVYLASWDGHQARLELTRVGAQHPCHDLGPGENLIAFHTRRYAKIPLVVRGPGAGPEVTASGVLADILRAIVEHESDQ
ncbi:MAG: bifunctional aspartate kinase/homoserine dehydrogenase I [Thermoanaerobaculia bacterium]